jgi:hypothetical protein
MDELSIFKMAWWPLHVATAWALSRDEEFTTACRRPDPGYLVASEADIRRQTGRPVMLFPTDKCAQNAVVKSIGKCEAVLPASVLSLFPRLDDANRAAALASVWRGMDPKEHRRIPLSHGAWWIASKEGSQFVCLDDRAVWQPAFELIMDAAINGQLSIFETEPPPVRRIPACDFDGMPIEFPARASEHRLGSPFQQGRDAFIRCDLLRGDQYISANADADRFGLQVNSDELLKLTGRLERAPKAASTEKTARAFVAKQLDANPKATLDEIREAAKGRGSRPLVDAAYRYEKFKRTGKLVKRGRRSKNPQKNNPRRIADFDI